MTTGCVYHTQILSPCDLRIYRCLGFVWVNYLFDLHYMTMTNKLLFIHHTSSALCVNDCHGMLVSINKQ